MSSQAGEEQPFIRVVRGDPTPDELAALVVVLRARAAARPGSTVDHRPSAWADPARALRQPLRPGPALRR